MQWKIHKKCCKPLSADAIAEIKRSDLERVEDYLMEDIRRPGGYPELYYILKRLRVLYDDDVDNRGDSACRLHGAARGIIFYPRNEIMMDMVASPHMANLLFGDEEDLLNPKTRMAKYELEELNGRPSDEYLESIEDETERERLKEVVKRYDALEETSWGREPSSMSYCYIYFNLIMACAISAQPTMSSFHDGCGVLRGGDPRRKSPESLVATAALRRAMELWTDKHVLASCGDAMAPAASLALTAVQKYFELDIVGGPNCRELEIVPGLTYDGAVRTCLSELLENAGSGQYSAKLLSILSNVFEKYSPAWTAGASLERRAKLVLCTVQYIVQAEDPADDDDDMRFCFNERVEMPKEAVNKLMKAVCGSYPDVAKEVLQKAADDGELIGPDAAGQNIDARAFIYFLIRSNKSSEEWASLDFIKLAREFGSKSYKNDVAEEIDECMRLARGDKLHNEIKEMIERIRKK